MKKTLFVVSDHHLGGSPGGNGKPSFEMCPAPNRARFAEFLRYVRDHKAANAELHLVIAGDLVDFLAEEPFQEFSDNATARRKLGEIIKRTDEVWTGLAGLLQAGIAVTIMLGNHDIELSLPGPRELLRERLGPGPLSLIYDNEALVEGPVLIEHGNRYDAWNAVSHDLLREIRSAVSRGEDPPPFKSPEGSKLVVKQMNPLKRLYPFVDLLKPEDTGVLPILAVLQPKSMLRLPSLAAMNAKMERLEKSAFDDEGQPLDPANVGAGDTDTDHDDQLLALAQELAGIPDEANVGAIADAVKGVKDLLTRLKTGAQDAARAAAVNVLYRAFRAYAELHANEFDTARERWKYLRPAQAAVRRGMKFVIMGHTHLVKRVRDSKKNVYYLNTGTWADLMRVPEGVLRGEEEAAKRQLQTFLSDLEAKKLDAWRQHMPTFAKVELDGGNATADVFFFKLDGSTEPVPDGQLAQVGTRGGPA